MIADPEYVFNEMCGRCTHEGRNVSNEQQCKLRPHDYATYEQRDIVRWLQLNFKQHSPVTGPCPSFYARRTTP
jgi:hypothetical protein